MVQNVLTVNDFNNVLDNYAGRLVLRTPTTRSIDNISGEETLTLGSAANIKVYFMRTNQKWDYAKEGFTERGDAVMLAKPTDSVKKDDIITADGNSYRIREAFNVPGVFNTSSTTVVNVYTACNLFLNS